MPYRKHHYAARALAVIVILFTGIYVALLCDPRVPFTLSKYTMETNWEVYTPGETIHVLIDYCTKKEQEVLVTFYLIDTIPLEGNIHPILMVGKDFDWKEKYAESEARFNEFCEAIWPSAFVINGLIYPEEYKIRAVFDYKVNMIKRGRLILESDRFTIENDITNYGYYFDKKHSGFEPLYPLAQ